VKASGGTSCRMCPNTSSDLEVPPSYQIILLTVHDKSGLLQICTDQSFFSLNMKSGTHSTA
jgi:hypothetical protein